MDRCDSCRHIITCPVCNTPVHSFHHAGVRGTKHILKIPITDWRIAHENQSSGIWHYAQPCQHRIHPTLTPPVPITYKGGPLWKNGYVWQNVYWGTYYSKSSSTQWINRLQIATLHIETDQKYSGLLSQYNVGIGTVVDPVLIKNDPPHQISNEVLAKTLMEWIKDGTVQDIGGKGAYNIFLPPSTIVSLSADLSCSSFCDYHDTVNGSSGPFYTVEPFPCSTGCNQCTNDPFDTLTQGLSEELVELKTDMDPGTGWVIGNEEICDYCLPPYELLLGDNKEICQYEISDTVLGTTGLQAVERTYQRDYAGDLVEIKAEGMLSFKVTPNHPILVSAKTLLQTRNPSKNRYLDSRGRWRYRYHLVPEYSSCIWKKAGDLKEVHSFSDGDCLVIPRIKGQLNTKSVSLRDYTTRPSYFQTKHLPLSFPLNPMTAWLLGMYVAEGSTNNFSLIQFSLAQDETELQDRIMNIVSNLGYSVWKLQAHSERCASVYFHSRPLRRLLKEICGKNASQKRIPDIILYHKDTKILEAFLQGYTAGDGYKNSNGYLYVVTVSRLLIQQLQIAYARLGLLMRIRRHRRPGRTKILGREVNLHELYMGVLNLRPKRQDFRRLHGDFFYVPIRNLKRLPYKGKVYNIRTKDHTYLVANSVVHNCNHNFVCEKLSTGEYVNAWYDKEKKICWKS